MPFEPGQSGNPGGKPKRVKLVADALIIELKSRDNKSTETDPQGIRKIVAKLVDLAEGGDMKAIEFVRDTTDGKPAQAIVGGDEDDNPVSLVTRIEIVAPSVDGNGAA